MNTTETTPLVIRWDTTGATHHTDISGVGRYSVQRVRRGLFKAYLNGEPISGLVGSTVDSCKVLVETRIRNAQQIATQPELTPPTSWTIMINNEQRLAIIEVLKRSDLKYTGSPAYLGDSEPPLAYWIEMLQQLPEVDKGELFEPAAGVKYRIVNGFCL